MGKIRKIIWYTSSLAGHHGGERLLLEGAKYFEDRGIRIYILTWHFDEKALFDRTYKANIIQLVQKNGRFHFTRLLMRPLILRKKIKEINPDIIITQAYILECVLLYFATLFSSVPYVTFIHGTMFRIPEDLIKYTFIFRKHLNEIRKSVVGYGEFIPLMRPKSSLKRRVLAELFAIMDYLAVRKAKRVFVLSNQVKWEVKTLYGKDATVLKGAFPSRIFDYEPKEDTKRKLGLIDKQIILSISSLIPKKRVDLCIKAFREISNKIENVFLVIGGTGPEEERLKDLVKRLDLESKVKFVGHIKEKELWDYYACCDVFIHPDVADFDIAPYEALALGKKVVWSTEMEIDEFLVGNKFVFAADPTVNDIATVTEKALTTHLGTMESTEKMKLSHYTWAEYFGKILKELERVRACNKF
jgi:glycosyltransferase involved in cell wall biosynthesis